MTILTVTSTLIVPTYTDPFYTVRCPLDGSTYVLDFAFNTREQCWYMNISDVNENLLKAGIKLVCNSPLGNKSYDPAMPPGVLMVVPNGSSTNDEPPGLFDLDQATGRCQLLYFAVKVLS